MHDTLSPPTPAAPHGRHGQVRYPAPGLAGPDRGAGDPWALEREQWAWTTCPAGAPSRPLPLPPPQTLPPPPYPPIPPIPSAAPPFPTTSEPGICASDDGRNRSGGVSCLEGSN